MTNDILYSFNLKKHVEHGYNNLHSSDLDKDESIVFPDRVHGVVIGGFGAVLPLGVGRQSKHVHFNIHTHLLISQKLTGHNLDIRKTANTFTNQHKHIATHKHTHPIQYLNLDGVSHNAIHYVLSEGVKVFVRAPHELRLQQVAAVAVTLEHTHV